MSFKQGALLARKGANHLPFIESLKEKDYEVHGFDNWTEAQWDAATFEMQLKDLEEHRKSCSGCTAGRLEELKEELKQKGWRGASRLRR